MMCFKTKCGYCWGVLVSSSIFVMVEYCAVSVGSSFSEISVEF